MIGSGDVTYVYEVQGYNKCLIGKVSKEKHF